MPSTRRPLRGHVKLTLVRECALDMKSERELADEFGVTHQAIGQFKVSNSDAIQAARLDIENKFATLWITNKMNRIAEYESDVDTINAALETAPVDQYPALIRAKCHAIRSAAEELGQLAPRAINATVQVRYSVAGVDMDNLR